MTLNGINKYFTCIYLYISIPPVVIIPLKYNNLDNLRILRTADLLRREPWLS